MMLAPKDVFTGSFFCLLSLVLFIFVLWCPSLRLFLLFSHFLSEGREKRVRSFFFRLSLASSLYFGSLVFPSLHLLLFLSLHIICLSLNSGNHNVGPKTCLPVLFPVSLHRGVSCSLYFGRLVSPSWSLHMFLRIWFSPNEGKIRVYCPSFLSFSLCPLFSLLWSSGVPLLVSFSFSLLRICSSRSSWIRDAYQ